MDRAEIDRVYADLAKPDFCTTTPDELEALHRAISTNKPERVIEIGTGSGLTAGFIARFMSEHGGSALTSIDSADTFFAAPKEAVGHLARKVFDGASVAVDIRPRTRAIDLTNADGPWNMAFIDADQAHPWPLLDTMALWPHLTGQRIVLHHGLQLFRRHRFLLGIGPRVLFNEVPEAHRHVSPANGWNMFSIDLRMRQGMFEEIALNALSIPWTARPPISQAFLDTFRETLRPHFTSRFWSEFDECAQLNRWSTAKHAYFAVRKAAAGLRR